MAPCTLRFASYLAAALAGACYASDESIRQKAVGARAILAKTIDA
jgi:hypothetical protein